MAVSRDAIEQRCELGRRAHAALLSGLSPLVADGTFDAGAQSTLDGWTNAMLVTHLARNADGHRRMIEGAALGEVWEQYDGGIDARRAGIDQGRGESAAAVLDDLTEAIERLEAAWASTDWVGDGRRTLSYVTPITELPFLRTREVELHHIDLGIGYEFADLDAEYVELELDRMEGSWFRRQPSDVATLPDAALALRPDQRLAWLTGRLDVVGLDPAGVF